MPKVVGCLVGPVLKAKFPQSMLANVAVCTKHEAAHKFVDRHTVILARHPRGSSDGAAAARARQATASVHPVCVRTA